MFGGQSNCWNHGAIEGVEARETIAEGFIVLQVSGAPPVTKFTSNNSGPDSAWGALNALGVLLRDQYFDRAVTALRAVIEETNLRPRRLNRRRILQTNFCDGPLRGRKGS